jgi:hypothetical protein
MTGDHYAPCPRTTAQPNLVKIVMKPSLSSSSRSNYRGNSGISLLTLILAAALCLAGLSARAVTVAYWQFEPDNLGADSSGNGHVLAITGAVSDSDVPLGAPGSGSIYFDGVTSSAATVAPLNLSDYTGLTIECFIKTNGQSDLRILYELSPVAGSNPGSLYMSFNEPGGFIRVLQGNAPNSYRATQYPTDSGWHHYAATIDNSGPNAVINVYIDGVLATNTPVVAASRTFRNDRFFIGARNETQFRFRGKFDEFRISSRVLPPSGFLIAPPLVDASILVTQPPTNTTVLQSRPVSFAVAATLQNGDSELLEYQWRTNGVNATGATAATFTLPRAYLEYNGMEVAVEISVHSKDGVTPVIHSATLNVQPDTVAPVAVAAAAQATTQVAVYFDETLDPISAANPGFYSLDGGVFVFNAHPLADGKTVVLVVSELTAPSHVLTCNGVTDLAGNPANNTVTVTNLSNGFASQDIGITAMGLVYGTNAGRFTALASGGDIWGVSDNFNYVCKPFTGDFDLRSQVLSFGPANAQTSAKAALMVRESLAPGSRHATVTVYPAQRVWVAYRRQTTDGTSSVAAGNWSVAWPTNVNYPNVWQRARRMGNTITLFGSTNGVDWVQVGNSMVMDFPETVYVGLGTAPNTGPAVTVNYSALDTFVVDDADITITQHPEDRTVQENTTATFSVQATVTGTSPDNLEYRWQKNGEYLFGAYSSSYITPLVTAGDSGSEYRAIVSVPGGISVTSQVAVLTVSNDILPPVALSTSSLDGQTVGVCFNEPVTAASAEDPANYSLSGGAVVYGATLRPDGVSVELTVMGLTEANYTLTVTGVRDLSNNPANNAVNGVVQGLTPEDIGWPMQAGNAFSCVPGTVEVKAGGFDIWDNTDAFHFTHLERTGDFDVRVRVASFGPEDANVNAKAVLMARESVDWGSRHVSITVYPRMGNWTAYHRAASMGASAVLSGNWRINWPAGNNFPNAWMRLKRNGNTITTYGSVDGEEWTQIGNPYTPEVPFPDTMQVGLGTTSLGDKYPPSPMVDVRYEQFGDYVITGAVVTILQHPSDTTEFENRHVSFAATVQVTGTPASNLSYQWLKNDAAIPGATGPTHTTPLVTLADDGARYRLRVSLPGGYTVFSEEATLTVVADVTPPGVSAVAALVDGPIGIRFDELVNADSAANAANYSLDGGATVTQATLMADGRTVVLSVAGLGAGPHQLTVTGVADLKGNVGSATVPVTQLDWVWGDIGNVAEPSSAYACDPAEINVRAGGANIWGIQDSFLFVRQARTGDFDVCVQLAHLSMVATSTRGGLMVREDHSPASRNFFVGTYAATGDNRWVSSVRLEPAGNTTLAPGDSYVLRAPDFAFPNAWLRLKRVSNTFTAYYGTNGVDWVQLGDQLTPANPYPATVHLGLATSPISSTPGLAATAQFLNYADWIEPVAAELHIVRTGQEIIISWPAAATGFTLKAADELTTATWTTVLQSPVLDNDRYTVTLPIDAERRFYRLEK